MKGNRKVTVLRISIADIIVRISLKRKKKLDFDVFVLDVPIQLFKMITRRCPVSETGFIRVVLILLLDFPTFF